MFEQDRQASPKKKFPSVVLLAAGGAAVATVVATLASVLATGGQDVDAGPPEPRADSVATSDRSVSQVPNRRPATVVVTVSTRVSVEKARDAAGSKPEERSEQPPEPTTTTSSQPPLTTQPPSNPPTTYDPPTTTSSSSSATTTATTTDAP